MRPIFEEEIPYRIVQAIEPNNKVPVALVEIKNYGETEKAQIRNIKGFGISETIHHELSQDI